MKKIFLMTDFGPDSIYTGQMKSVILGINPKAQIIDLAHDISPQNLKQASLYLQSSFEYIPDESIILTVVDPGVGSDRKLLYIKTDRHDIICPDNGIVNELNKINPFLKIINIDYRNVIDSPISNTFHGRDIFAPLAGKLSLSDKIDIAGSEMNISQLHENIYPQPLQKKNSIIGEVIFIDKFGNLVTNIPNLLLTTYNDTIINVAIHDINIKELKNTYSASKSNLPIAYIGSMNTLEIGIFNVNMAEKYRLQPAEQVILQHI